MSQKDFTKGTEVALAWLQESTEYPLSLCLAETGTAGATCCASNLELGELIYTFKTILAGLDGKLAMPPSMYDMPPKEMFFALTHRAVSVLPNSLGFILFMGQGATVRFASNMTPDSIKALVATMLFRHDVQQQINARGGAA